MAATEQTTGRPQAVLAVNAGSSSLKFAVYPVAGDGVGPAGLSGLAEGLEPNGRPEIRIQVPGRDAAGREPLSRASGESPFAAALRAVIDAVEQHSGAHLCAVAHRIVHGGSRCSASVRIDDEVRAYLETLNPLAPLHQPANLAGVDAFRRATPELPQFACFDTAFHATIPELEQRFALAEEWFVAGVRRYGFHGLSYRYVTDALLAATPRAKGRMLLAHLGNGASLAGVRDGQGFATSMGLSAVDGLMMGTRTGAIDPGVLLHWLRQGMDGPAIEKLLYKQSGLLGVSGISADMRTLRASSEPSAGRAIGLFTHRLLRESGGIVASLGGLDVLGFAGGIGENDVALRAAVGAGLAYLGVKIDPGANAKAVGGAMGPIHAEGSAIEVWVVPTDEGRVMARDALALLARA